MLAAGLPAAEGRGILSSPQGRLSLGENMLLLHPSDLDPEQTLEALMEGVPRQACSLPSCGRGSVPPSRSLEDTAENDGRCHQVSDGPAGVTLQLNGAGEAPMAEFIPSSYRSLSRQIWRQSLIIPFFLLCLAPSVSAEVHRKKFSTASAYLIVEILDNDLVHFEVSTVGKGPSVDQPLYTSSMVAKTDYHGPTSIIDNGNVVETSDIKIEVNPSNLCITEIWI
jgi:hypothetical protein